MKRLIVATDNKNKIKEIREILGELDIRVLSKEDLGLGDLEILEDGRSLEENSYKKAYGIWEKTGDYVIADDSGLFVDLLGGQPGVHSSRYAGKDGDDQLNNKKLLESLSSFEEEKRTASFRCVITLITESGEKKLVEGRVDGHIVMEPRGEKGFGYDPLFIPKGYSETFGELSSSIKNSISHRSRALKKLREELLKII